MLNSNQREASPITPHPAMKKKKKKGFSRCLLMLFISVFAVVVIITAVGDITAVSILPLL